MSVANSYTFDDLVTQAKQLIPQLAPSWTDHNPSDPGITLVELFAFVTEMLIYRADRISDANKRAFIRLLRGPDRPLRKAVDQEIRDALDEVRREERAVTPADYERLANEVGDRGVVARACCLPRRNLDDVAADKATRDAPAHVSVVVVPYDANADPAMATQAVWNELEPRRLLTTRLHVRLPREVPVSVNITVHIFVDQDETTVSGLISGALLAWFDPRTGGPARQGWPFGGNVYLSDIYAVVDGIPGVDYLEPDTGLRPMVATSLPDREILEQDVLVGLRLEPDELVRFDPNKSSFELVRQGSRY